MVGGDQVAKSPENSENTGFCDAKNCPENHSCFSFSPMVLTQIHRKRTRKANAVAKNRSFIFSLCQICSTLSF